MRSKSTVTLAVVLALLAISAVVASAALAAAPEFIKAGKKNGFTAKSGVTTLYLPSGRPVPCTVATSKGKLTGTKTKTLENVFLTFTGCKVSNASPECKVHSGGAASDEEITTAELRGELGETTESMTKVGELLQPASGEALTEIEGETSTGTICLSKGIITEKVIGELKPIGKSQSTEELIFSVEPMHENIQAIRKFQNGTKFQLEYLGGNLGLESIDEMTFEEPVEVT